MSLAALGTVTATEVTIASISKLRSGGSIAANLRNTLLQMLSFSNKQIRKRALVVVTVTLILAAVGLIAYRYSPESDFGHTATLGSNNLVGSTSSASEATPAPPSESQPEPSPPSGFAEDVTQPETRQNPPPAGLRRVPAPPDLSTYNRKDNGARIADDNGTTGLGKLTVENGTASDAVVRLVDTNNNSTVRWFYVQSKAAATVGGIEPGIYALMYTSGADWDEAADEFRVEPNYSAFERQFTYSETPDGENITKYKTISVTLHAVPSGNVRTRHISRQEFLKGHRQQASR